QVLRPVDPHVAPQVPRPIAGILDDDVQLLAGGRVVVVADVEVRADGEDRDRIAGLHLVPDARGAGGRALDELVRLAGDEELLHPPGASQQANGSDQSAPATTQVHSTTSS